LILKLLMSDTEQLSSWSAAGDPERRNTLSGGLGNFPWRFPHGNPLF
jgi:hypothetical protein